MDNDDLPDYTGLSEVEIFRIERERHYAKIRRQKAEEQDSVRTANRFRDFWCGKNRKVKP